MLRSLLRGRRRYDVVSRSLVMIPGQSVKVCISLRAGFVRNITTTRGGEFSTKYRSNGTSHPAARDDL